MNKYILLLLSLSASFSLFAQEEESKEPWLGKYPMSIITKTRTANTVGKSRLSVALKVQDIRYDEKEVAGSDGDYADIAADFNKLITVTTLKYGWAENHHVALGIPQIWVDKDDQAVPIDSEGLGNIFIFEKWKFLDETSSRPAMAMDAWYYFNTGDSADKLGSDDDFVKLALQVSKAWKGFSLHFNPAYRWDLHDGVDVGEVNIGSYINVNKAFKLAVEYNFTVKESTVEGAGSASKEGKSHDLVPGILWKPGKTSSIKIGAVCNLDSTMTYRDKIGLCFKLFYKF